MSQPRHRPDELGRRIAKLQVKYPPPQPPRLVFHPAFGVPEKILDGVWYETGFTRETAKREFPFIWRQIVVKEKEYGLRAPSCLYDPGGPKFWIFEWFDAE
jgi:hypothetical protein